MKVRWQFVVALVLCVGFAAAVKAQTPRFPSFPFLFPAPTVAVAPQSSDKIKLYDEINAETAAVVIEQIQAANKAQDGGPIYLFINSPGGDVGAGGNIIDAMKASKRPVITVCVSLCASMAAITFEYGSKRQMMGHSTVMFHEASASLQGSLSHMLSRLTLYMRMTAEYETKISGMAGIPVEEFRVHELREWWLQPDEAMAAHLADSIATFTDYPASMAGAGSASRHLPQGDISPLDPIASKFGNCPVCYDGIGMQLACMVAHCRK